MRDILEETHWDMHLKDLNVSEMWDSITNTLNHCTDTCIPKNKHPPNKKHI